MESTVVLAINSQILLNCEKIVSQSQFSFSLNNSTELQFAKTQWKKFTKDLAVSTRIPTCLLHFG